jgi:hypothetical protein
VIPSVLDCLTADPIIGEIRRVRSEISTNCGHSVGWLGEHYLELERKARASGQYRFADAPQKSAVALHDKPAESGKE